MLIRTHDKTLCILSLRYLVCSRTYVHEDTAVYYIAFWYVINTVYVMPRHAHQMKNFIVRTPIWANRRSNISYTTLWSLYSAKVAIFYIFRWKDSVYQMICVINVKTCVQLNTYINHWVDVYTCAFECLNLSRRKSCEMNNNSFPAPTILPVMILLYSMTPQEYCILSEYNAYYGDAIENHGWFLHLAHCLQLI